MKPKELETLRTELGMSQQQLATAVNVSFATVNRWESENKDTQRPMPLETERLLECLADLLKNTRATKSQVGVEEIKEAVSSTGVSAVVARAIMAGLVSKNLIGRAALVPALGWIGGITGALIGVAALPFFAKLAKKNQKPDDKDKP